MELREKVLKRLESVDDYLLKEILGIIELEDAKSEVTIKNSTGKIVSASYHNLFDY